MDEKSGTGADPAGESNQAVRRSNEITPASSRDLDETYAIYKQQDARYVDPQEARSVLRKIDLHILPILMMSYMLQYLDKQSINFASVYGLQKGTNLVGQDYSWLSSIFYFGDYRQLPSLGDTPNSLRLSLRTVSGRISLAKIPNWQVHGWLHHW